MGFDKTYDPGKYEDGLYAQWEDAGVFKPQTKDAAKEPFTIIMPPPNANGSLHAGHAVGYTLEDIITRYKRAQGHPTLWQPGTDHAGIETQFVYEKRLKEQGLTRFDLGREEFYKQVEEFTRSSQDNILNQFRSMGFSADWSRLKFTLDQDVIDTVYETFKQMHKDGHIYRGRRIVNWCPNCHAAFADIEVEREEREDPFYTFKYGPFEIGTARPETKFGDKYVVMHPDDERYSDYKHGDTFETEWINGPITATVIKDEAIDMKFGTGAMTITPWHDATDFEIAERHNLDKQQIIDENGNLLEIAEEFTGMPITEARDKIVEKLERKGLLVKTESKVHAVALHDRCKNMIEPQISLQWFVRMAELNKPVLEAFENDLNVYPARFKKIATNWLENEHDWCISRGTWWGITIPVYYRLDSADSSLDEYIIAFTEQEAIDYYGEDNYQAETDTFDTWYSSGQWPYATLQSTVDDFDAFYPTSLMGTAKEILHKWVTRMVMFSLYRHGKVPFRDIYLWGLVTDEHGAKMSKSKGNVLDPLKLTAKYGTDALRFTAALTNTPGNDSPLGENKVLPQRNFCNKLWNIARFIDGMEDGSEDPAPISSADHWICQQFNTRQAAIDKAMSTYRLNEAAYELYHYIWDDLADWYLEASKAVPNPALLKEILRRTLVLAHPFMPFITEAIWQNTGEPSLLASDPWPEGFATNENAAEKFASMQGIVSDLRVADKQLVLGTRVIGVSMDLTPEDAAVITKLTRFEVGEATGITLSPLVTIQATPQEVKSYEKAKSDKKKSLLSQIKSLEARLANENYVAKAPKALVDETKSQLETLRSELDSIQF
ncbi:MAG: valine--tRNA ligase [Patescibacteria group bacterium]